MGKNNEKVEMFYWRNGVCIVFIFGEWNKYMDLWSFMECNMMEIKEIVGEM